MFPEVDIDKYNERVESFNSLNADKVVSAINKYSKISESFNTDHFVMSNDAYKQNLINQISAFLKSLENTMLPNGEAYVNSVTQSMNTLVSNIKSYTLTLPSYNSEDKINELVNRTNETLSNTEEQQLKVLSNAKMEREAFNESSKKIINSLNRKIDKQEKKFLKLESDYNKLSANKAGDIVTASYDTKRGQENTRAWWLFGSAVTLTISVIVLTIIAFTEKWFSQSEDISAYAIRMVFVFTLTPLSAYLFKQSSNHRHFANYYAQMSTELKTVHDFIKDFEPEQKKQVQLLLSLKFFGNASSKISKNEEGVKPDLMKLVEMVYGSTNPAKDQ